MNFICLSLVVIKNLLNIVTLLYDQKTKTHSITSAQLFKSCIGTYGAIDRINR